MASAHLHASIVQRSAGQSAVGAAAYAARARMVDERTGEIHDYSRKNADVMFSFVGLPKDAPERLRDPARLANAMELRETRKNSQTARKFVTALPHELTPEQREWLVKDFGRENFTRKGLAYHVAIHKPHERGDQRNFHAHWTVSTRTMDKTGAFTEKDRESNERAALIQLRGNWEKLVNRHLERHGHDARISMQTLEAQGIDRMPEIHLGQAASALERKGHATDRGALLREIANDNAKGQEAAKDREEDSRKEVVYASEPQTVDRDEQDAEWQESVDAASIVYADERRRAFLAQQEAQRVAFQQAGEDMAARHALSWGEAIHRQASEAISGYQPGSVEEAGEAATGSFSFFMSLLTSWAESISRSASRTTGRPAKARSSDKQQQEAERLERQRKEQQHRELEALLTEQAREREQWERRRAEMLRQQAQAQANFEQEVRDKSSLQTEFRTQTEGIERYREAMGSWEKQRVATQEKSKDAGPKRDGPELGS